MWNDSALAFRRSSPNCEWANLAPPRGLERTSVANLRFSAVVSDPGHTISVLHLGQNRPQGALSSLGVIAPVYWTVCWCTTQKLCTSGSLLIEKGFSGAKYRGGIHPRDEELEQNQRARHASLRPFGL